MRYCPYCSTQISESAKSCHNCKKSLDFEAIASVFEASEASEINKSAVRKIWIKEHARFVWPVVTLIIGFIVGGAVLYSLALAQAASEKDTLNSEIEKLNAQISQINSDAQGAQSGLQGQIQEKEKIITILTSQRQSLTRIINFTRRFTNNSIITPNSEAEATYFKNNFRYLRGQFDDQQAELDNTTFADNRRFNLKTAPQFLED
ncbi:MAG: hypothetical protein D8M58_05505 [Calditrichaeota bacterium]|nr:MAG: hypothetical protein DWQ03_21000 [Calditrichota bacterium]MBL1204832.1 hypothetical protein [Calditrichota bacterium]NOG44661.1 hypothetical protein [Calditrichota bacterium]